MSGKGSSTGINVGGPSILMIFVLLCLTTFATLSLVSANADYRLTRKAAQAAQDFYQADSLAEEYLAAVDAVLQDNRSVAGTAGDFQRLCGTTIPMVVEGTQVDSTSDGVEVRYQIQVNDSQVLQVTIQAPYGGASSYTRTQWQLASSGEWEPQEGGMELFTQEDLMLLLQ